MSDIISFSVVRATFLADLQSFMPAATAADLDAFDRMVMTDRLVTDDCKPHPDLVAWVEDILRRGDSGAVSLPVSPVPKVGPAGAEVVL